MYYNLHRTMKKPPDKYKCIKVPLHSILHKDDDNSINIFNRIQDVVYRANYITTKTHLLLRLWCLEKYHNCIEIPTIDEETIKMCMKFDCRRISFVNIHAMNKRATPEKYLIYKHALMLFKLYNSIDYSVEWSALNLNQI